MSHVRIEVAALTDCGLKRQRNEDALLIGNWLAAEQKRFLCQATLDLSGEPVTFMAADGIGGEECGNVASRLAAEAFMNARADSPDAVRAAATRARDSMAAFAHANRMGARMGTTVAGLTLSREGITAFAAGDCFVGRFSGQYCQGILGSYEFESPSSEVYGFIGIVAPEAAAVRAEQLGALTGRFVVLTDGVSRYVPPQTLDSLLRGEQTPHQAVEDVSRAVIEAGAGDNFSIICLDVSSIAEEQGE